MKMEIIQALSSIGSVVAAIIALIIALGVEKRNHKRFIYQIDESKRIAEANVKPLLAIFTIGYENFRGMRLANSGQGTAIITKVTIQRDGRLAQNVAELIDIPNSFSWDTFWRFRGTNLYIPAGENRKLLELSQKNLIAQGFSGGDALNILKELKNEMDQIEILIEYEDILGNSQKPCHYKGDDHIQLYNKSQPFESTLD